MPRLLLVEDDRLLLRSLEKLFGTEGYYCRGVLTGAEARRTLADTDDGSGFDLVLLDLNLPDMDGFGLCRQIREHHHMPILILTARNNQTDKLVGLEIGADDYVTKPFDPRELLARVRAHLRRSSEYAHGDLPKPLINLGRVVLDPHAREVTRDGVPVSLTTREFELLSLLAAHRGKALTAEWLFESVWGCSGDLGLKTLPVYIGRIRRKLEADPAHPRLLLTVRGYGYKLVSTD